MDEGDAQADIPRNPVGKAADWVNDDDPSRLAARVERVLVVVQRHMGDDCRQCGREICGHEAVFCIASGFEGEPLCLGCTASTLDRPRDLLRDELTAFALSKPCLVHGWRLSDIREGHDGGGPPACLWPAGGDLPDAAAAEDPPTATEDATEADADDGWDAGDLGCGELVLELRKRLKAAASGSLFRLVATDPGAPEDLPAWCRMTGNPLVRAEHPVYLIKRKDDS